MTITARPPATTPTGEASFSFRASEAGSTFQCRLDGAAYTPCTSPKGYAGLGAGEHTFAVRARDRAGNVGAAATARWSFVPPDTTPPSVSITSAQISGGDASFSSASEPGATFTCSLDGAGPVGCTSPAIYTGLGPGAHSFAVRATDAAGNVSQPATHAWTIAPPPAPDLVISQLTENSFVVTNIGNAPAGAFVVSVTLVGNFTFGGLAPGQSQTRTWSTCRRGTITAIADRGGTVAESNEGNNSRTITSDC